MQSRRGQDGFHGVRRANVTFTGCALARTTCMPNVERVKFKFF